MKQWINKNREKWNKQHASYMLTRRKSDIIFALTKRLRDRFRMALKKNLKRGSAVKDLGCSIEEFKHYIESKFQPGMTWDNQSQNGWHLDHIIPLSKFNLQDRNQLLIALHYTNYQPLWKFHNLSKSNLSVLDFRDGMF
jgi:hypothetical protein